MKATDKQIQKNNSKRTKKQISIYRLLKANTYRNGRKNYVYDESIYYYFYYVFRIFDSFIRSEIIQRKAYQSFDDRPVLRDFSWCRISFIRYVAGLCSRCFLALKPCFICYPPLLYDIPLLYIYLPYSENPRHCDEGFSFVYLFIQFPLFFLSLPALFGSINILHTPPSSKSKIYNKNSLAWNRLQYALRAAWPTH